jgi:MYXO-CTERM domain-containing protein
LFAYTITTARSRARNITEGKVMKRSGSNWLALAALAAGLGMASGAHAAWTFGGVDGGAATTSYGADATGATLTVSGAYAANGGTLTGAGTSIVAGNTYGINGFAAAGTAWTTSNASASLQFYSGGGLGMASDSTSSTVPNHAMDNGPATNGSNLISGLGNTESVLLSFSKSVVLSSIGLGYIFGDADVSLFRYTGASAPSLNGTGASLSNMQSAGWELVGNYGDLVYDISNPYNSVNAGGKGSTWWLISAYNSNYGAATSGTVNQGNDFFKVYAVAGTACVGNATQCGQNSTTVAEPASLALVALAGVGAIGARRRRKQPLAG